MTDAMLPVIRQMLDTADDRARAALLLRVPDAVLWKYRPAFEAACRRAAFDAGLAFIEARRAAWHAVRQPDGSPDARFDAVRAAFAAFAGGGGG